MLSLMPAQKKPGSAFGARLIALRKAQGLTQTQFAEKAGVTQPVVSYYESKAEVPSGHLVAQFAQALAVTADELLGLKPLKKNVAEPAIDPALRRYWKRIRVIASLPERDQKSVLRMLDNTIRAHGGRQPAA